MRAATLFVTECRKARRRHDLPVTVGIALMAVLWAGMNRTPDTAQAFSALYYAVPIMNAVIMPVGMATLASRIWDVETKGQSCRLLFTLQSRTSLLGGKAALGLAENLAICLLEPGGIAVLGMLQGATEPLRPARLVWLGAATFAVNAMLYFFSLLLSIRARTPAAALAVGFCGALIGLFAAFMPAGFSYLVPFGYYIPLSAVTQLWDPATRISQFVLETPRFWLLGLTVFFALLAAAGCRRAILYKEV